MIFGLPTDVIQKHALLLLGFGLIIVLAIIGSAAWNHSVELQDGSTAECVRVGFSGISCIERTP